MKLKDLIGKNFGKLTIIERQSSNRSGSSTWLCKCQCGVEKVYSSDHLTRKSNPVKSCGCYRLRKAEKHELWKGVGDISGNWWYNHVLRSKTDKKRKELEVTVTINEAWELFIKQDKKCSLSGLHIKFGSSTHTNTASLDRIDSSIGYTRDNIQWVHKDINFMKRIYDQHYFIKMCRLVSNNNCEIT